MKSQNIKKTRTNKNKQNFKNSYKELLWYLKVPINSTYFYL